MIDPYTIGFPKVEVLVGQKGKEMWFDIKREEFRERRRERERERERRNETFNLNFLLPSLSSLL